MGTSLEGGATRAAVLLPWERPAPGAPVLRQADDRLSEAVSLAAGIGLDVRLSRIFPLRARRPSTLLGEGQVEAAGEAIAEAEVEVAVVDAALSPVQQRNLERAWKCKVIDRTGLILEIFGDRARTREGSLQVELAHLDYQRSRLVKSWTHLERQRGGFGFLGGPGESQIELDRRLIGERIAKIRRELEEVRRTRGLHRGARRRVPYPIVALVGYTNAGKSTLFNRLTGADVFAHDLLFATLDPTMRALVLPSGRQVIISDTVGFISELPTELVAAFRATLEEIAEADVILHVRDVASHDGPAQRADVLAVLEGLATGPSAALDTEWPERVIEVLNKVDLLDDDRRASLPAGAIAASAATGEGCRALLGAIDARLAARMVLREAALDPADGETLAWLYRHGEVFSRTDAEDAIRVQVRLTPENAARFDRRRAV
ncbi:MAG: GTPase HflX [Acetobacteraceae bacterium]|nr:GTPase HflX [Acetobacteraceae bacterium]